MSAERAVQALGCGILAVSVAGLASASLGFAYPTEAQIAVAIIGVGLGFAATASVDTLPKGGDAQQAPCASKGSEVAATGGETPNGGTNG